MTWAVQCTRVRDVPSTPRSSCRSGPCSARGSVPNHFRQRMSCVRSSAAVARLGRRCACLGLGMTRRELHGRRPHTPGPGAAVMKLPYLVCRPDAEAGGGGLARRDLHRSAAAPCLSPSLTTPQFHIFTRRALAFCFLLSNSSLPALCPLCSPLHSLYRSACSPWSFRSHLRVPMHDRHRNRPMSHRQP